MRLVAHALDWKHYADYAQQAPYRFGVILPAQLD